MNTVAFIAALVWIVGGALRVLHLVVTRCGRTWFEWGEGGSASLASIPDGVVESVRLLRASWTQWRAAS